MMSTSIRIISWGMPLVVYYDPTDEGVTPGQHVARALGGPLFNLTLLLAALLVRHRIPTGTAAYDAADAAVQMNASSALLHDQNDSIKMTNTTM